MKNIVVLISGEGSNLQAIIDACASGQISGKICAVISNNADAYGLVRAKKRAFQVLFLNVKLMKHIKPWIGLLPLKLSRLALI